MRVVLNKILSVISSMNRIAVIKLTANVRFLGKNTVRTGVQLKTNYGGCIIVGEGTELGYYVILMTYGGFIEIGKNCSINPNSIIYGHGGVRIGDNVLIAAQCVVVSTNHIFSDRTKLIAEQGATAKGIIIEDDVWLGAGCKILDGVVIGKGAVIAAGSVVTVNVPEYCVYAGVPARKIKDR